MAKIKVETFTVPVTGVGRRDYSQDVQLAVEPTIRSYQEPYTFQEVYVLNAGQTRTIDIDIPSGQVVMLYDWLCCCPANVLLSFEGQTIDQDGTVNSVFHKAGYQKVDHHLPRGVPVFRTIRLIITNYSTLNLTDVEVSLAGSQMSQEEYYMRLMA